MSNAIEKSLSARRHFTDLGMRGLIIASMVVAIAPLVAVLFYTFKMGIEKLTPSFLTHSMKGVGPLDANGGVYHAIIGTLEQVAIAYVIAVPLGLLVAIYIVEIGRGPLVSATRYLIDVMTGIPSIVAGLFVFAFWVIGLGMGFSGFAAGLSLSILMLPVVVRSSEEMLRLVPTELREASQALGIPKWRTTLSVVVPTAASGIVTGVLLAIARVTGETAPLLLTAFGYDAIRTTPFEGAQSSIPLFVYSQASSAFEVAIQRAWAGALTLIAIVLILTIVARVITSRRPVVGQ